MPIQNVSLGPGFIIYTQSLAINDFEGMPIGPCTNLTGWFIQGNITVGATTFVAR